MVPTHAIARLVPTLVALALVVSVVATTADAQEQTTDSSDLMLVLDASGSMWGQVQKEHKIVIARRVLADVIGKVPAGVNIGLVAYGHRREADCDDIEIVVPLGQIDRAALVKKINSLSAKGKTPITRTLTQVFAELVKHGRPATVVFVSDGIETCGGDPCQVVRDAKAKGVQFVMHVIGFDLGDVDVPQLECAAQAGGGLYFSAANAGQFANALGQAVAIKPETPLGNLLVETTANGRLTDVMLTVKRAGSDEEVAGIRTYETADSNPRIIPLEKGTYDLVATAVRIEGRPEQHVPDIVIEDGMTVEKKLDFSTGKLRVKVTRNGALSDATLTVLRAGTNDQVAGGRTYAGATSNPIEVELAAGTYDAEIVSVEIAGKPSTRWEGIVIGGDETVVREHEFLSGMLQLGVKQDGRLVDATVQIVNPDTNESIAAGRTYTSPKSNPKSFILSPGKYSVRIAPVKKGVGEKREIAVDVQANGTVEQVIDFAK